MPFTVACEACGTRLAIPDSLYEKKIKGRTVSIACKNCRSDIRVDGTKPREEVDVLAKAAAEKRKAKAEPAAAAKPEPKAAAKSEPKPAAKPAAKAEAKPAAKAEAKPAAKAEPKAAAQPEPKAAKPEPKPAAKPAAKTEPKPVAKAANIPTAAAARKAESKPATARSVSATAPSGIKSSLTSAKSSLSASTATSKLGAGAARKPGPPPVAKKDKKEEPPLEALWAVSYGDDDDRELTVPETAAALRRGEIDGETLVWHEGMDDWKTIAEVPRLAVYLPKPAETPKPPLKPGATTLADAPMSKREVAPPSPPSPAKAAAADQAAPSPFEPQPKSDADSSDVVSSVSAEGLAALVAKAPAPKEEPAFGKGGLADAIAPAPEAAADKPEPVVLPTLEGVDTFKKSNPKRYLPLAVLGVLILVGVIVLSIGGSSEREVPTASPVKPAASQPPRDIRRAKRLSGEAEPAAEQQSAAQAKGKQASGRDALWGDDKPGAKPKEETKAGDESDEAAGGDDLVSAMKKGLESGKGKGSTKK